MERQIQLQFEPVAHKYTDETGKEYTSVTTVIGKYKKPFNNRYWSMYTALKNSGVKVRPDGGKDKAIIVNSKYRSLDSLYRNPINSREVSLLVGKWDKMTIDACARGNEIHDFLEDGINASKGDDGSSNVEVQPGIKGALSSNGLEVEIRTKHDLDTTKIGDRFPEIYDRLLHYINAGCVIYAEKKIYTVQFGIAGMIDVLITKGKMFAILDWKTNKDEMMFNSGYFKKEPPISGIGPWVKGTQFIRTSNKLLTPLTNIDECKGMIYTLQLSLYAYIMELWGYKLVKNGLEIFHMRPGLKPKLIKVAYKKEDVHKMLTHHVNNVDAKKTPKRAFGLHKNLR